MIKTGLTYSGGMAQKIEVPDISIKSAPTQELTTTSQPKPTLDQVIKKERSVAPLPGWGMDDFAKKAESAKQVKEDPATKQTEKAPVSKTTAKKSSPESGIVKYLKNKKVIVGVAIIVILAGVLR
jgi:cobalamin biosynthesis Mg chelatase CobN